MKSMFIESVCKFIFLICFFVILSYFEIISFSKGLGLTTGIILMDIIFYYNKHRKKQVK